MNKLEFLTVGLPEDIKKHVELLKVHPNLENRLTNCDEENDKRSMLLDI